MVRPGTQFNSVLGLGTLAYRAIDRALRGAPKSDHVCRTLVRESDPARVIRSARKQPPNGQSLRAFIPIY